jgi:hypothetical protein
MNPGESCLFEVSDWVTPLFVKIKKMKINRISPYPENGLWEKDETLAIEI